MGKGGLNLGDGSIAEYTREEVKQHNTKTDRWIIIQGLVYDVTRFSKRHPGGERILSNIAGEDATDAWTSFHTRKEYTAKFMKPLLVGKVKEEHEDMKHCVDPPWIEDYRKLIKTAESMGLFKPNPLFYVAIMAHLWLFEFLGWATLYWFGVSWLTVCISGLFLATAQAQAGWSQHDYGHLSVFKNNRWNHWMQLYILNHFKGASSAWWNYRHNNHHSKPNVVRKDPDIRLDMLFLVGDVLPKEWGKKKKGFMPYNHQHNYFYFILPPLLLPLYFNYEIPYYIISRKQWSELFWMLTFFVRWHFMFSSMTGFFGMLGLFLLTRFIESHWFVWATQMSHIPREVDYEQNNDWVTMQLKATCNIEQSWFNDWFSGHLNFQIEHHLFPSMPRHNLRKIAPLVKSMCEKHGLEYINKPMLQGFADIVGSLKKSGEMWLDAYNM